MVFPDATLRYIDNHRCACGYRGIDNRQYIEGVLHVSTTARTQRLPLNMAHVTGLDRSLRTRVGVLGVLTIVAYGSWYYGFGVLLDDLRGQLNSSDRVLTLGFGIAELLTGVLGIAAGRVLDRRGVRVVFGAGATGGAGLLWLSSMAGGPWMFAVLFGAAGGIIGATGFYAMTQSIVARLAPGLEAISIARLTVWGAFSSPLFIPGTGLANRWWGWRTTLRIDAVLVGVAFAAAMAVVDRTRATSSQRPSSSPISAVRTAFSVPVIRRLALSACAAAAGMAILLVYQVPLLVAAGLGATLASTVAGARGFAQLLGRLPLSRIIARYGIRPSLRVARAMLAIGCLLVVVSGHTILAVVYVVVAGASIGAMSPLDGIYARTQLPPDDLGTLMGAVALLTGVAGALGPFLAAVLVDTTGHRSSAAFLAAACATIGALTLSTPASNGTGPGPNDPERDNPDPEPRVGTRQPSPYLGARQPPPNQSTTPRSMP